MRYSRRDSSKARATTHMLAELAGDASTQKGQKEQCVQSLGFEEVLVPLQTCCNYLGLGFRESSPF